MNDYEERRQARIDRYRERAEKARAESAELSRRSSEMASAIPFGQPVHGAADRRCRERIGQKMEQAIAADKKAQYYEDKAEAAERSRAISSDDPEAAAKLTDKLEQAEKAQAYMKNVNAYYRKHGTCQGCEGMSDERAAELDDQVKNGCSWERAPFPSYALSNNNQEIHRLRGRIRQLTEARELGYRGWEFDGGKVVANADKNRLQVFFDDVPSAETRQAMKNFGFHWARSEGAWQRQLTDNAIYAACHIKAIEPRDGSDPVKLQPKRSARNEQQR